tara:strand:+ start:3533 stop:3688 length:156 start_codon:yes stop_codon:yes gene_type:complete
MTYTRKKHLKVWEDAPMNATGVGMSLPVDAVKKKKKKRMPDEVFKVLKRKL